MLDPSNDDALAPIPEKKYFTIGEAAKLCKVKPHVLRYWEQEFEHIMPVKRGGNRRYYQYQDLLAIRYVRSLLYDDGYTIEGARQKLAGNKENQVDSSEYVQLIRQTITEIEDVLKLMK